MQPLLLASVAAGLLAPSPLSPAPETPEPQKTLVRGQVALPDGSRLTGSERVTLYVPGKAGQPPVPMRSVPLAADGAFALERKEAEDPYFVGLSAPFLHAADAGPFVGPPRDAVRMSAVPAGQLSVDLRFPRDFRTQDLAGQRFGIRAIEASGFARSALTRAGGSVTFDGVPQDATVQLFSLDPDVEFERAAFLTPRAGETVRGTFTLRRPDRPVDDDLPPFDGPAGSATLTLETFALEGVPRDVRVTLSGRVGYVFGPNVRRAMQGESPLAGPLEFRDLPFGRYRVDLSAREHFLKDSLIEHRRAGSFVLLLSRKPRVSGFVVDHRGRPAAGARLVTVVDDIRQEPVDCDATGRFDVRLHRDGNLRLWAAAPGARSSEAFETRLEAGRHVDGIELQFGAPPR